MTEQERQHKQISIAIFWDEHGISGFRLDKWHSNIQELDEEDKAQDGE